MDLTNLGDFLKQAVSRKTSYELPKELVSDEFAFLSPKQVSNIPQQKATATTTKSPKFKPITDWIIYRNFENQILQGVRQKIKEQYGINLPANIQDKLRARLFAKSLEHGIFRFTDQDTLRYIRFVENPKALIPYFATLEKYAPTTRGTILTPLVKQELGLKETAELDELMEFVQNLQQLQQK